jgi:hypothetical protein
VKPDTVVRWHRAGFRLYWNWFSRRRRGRPRVTAEVRALVGRVATENATWGALRVHGELRMLGFEDSGFGALLASSNRLFRSSFRRSLA